MNPPHFNHEYYQALNPDLFWLNIITKNDLTHHFIKFAKSENRPYLFYHLYPHFNWLAYKKANPDLCFLHQSDYEYHYFKYGSKEKRPITIPESSLFNEYLEKYPALTSHGILTQSDFDSYLINVDKSNPLLKELLPTKPTLGIFITGFGMPQLDMKIEILKHNLEILKQLKEIYTIDLYIFFYSLDKAYITNQWKDSMNQYVSNFYCIQEKGFVAEFMHKYISKAYKKYDYIIMSLDDVEWDSSIDIQDLLKVYILEQLDILALPLHKKSEIMYEIMVQQTEPNWNYRQVNFAEYFFYFMSKEKAEKYFSLLSNETKWGWGIDLILDPLGFKLGLYDKYFVKHYFKSISYNPSLPNPMNELNQLKKKYTFVKNKIVLKKEKY